MDRHLILCGSLSQLIDSSVPQIPHLWRGRTIGESLQENNSNSVWHIAMAQYMLDFIICLSTAMSTYYFP